MTADHGGEPGDTLDVPTRAATMVTDMSEHAHRQPFPGRDPGAWDDALCRLEDVLLAAPYDRALPDLDEILQRASVPLDVVRQDERALKLLSEAILARPLSARDDVRRSRAHVEMMTLEVEVLTHRLRDPGTPAEVVHQATGRLAELAEQLDALRGDL